jgi:hypothetical protein
MASEGLGVVLDPHGCGFGGSEGVDGEQVGQGPVVNGEGLSDLEEPDEFEPVHSLGPGLVAVNFREARVNGWIGNDEPVDVREPGADELAGADDLDQVRPDPPAAEAVAGPGRGGRVESGGVVVRGVELDGEPGDRGVTGRSRGPRASW